MYNPSPVLKIRWLIAGSPRIHPSNMDSKYEFPKIHSFPPMYTKQPNSTVLQKQLESWCKIIVSYCQHYRITSITPQGTLLHSQISDLDKDLLEPIFENAAIGRAVDDEFKALIFKHLIHKLYLGEYINAKQPEIGLLVYWRSLSEWGSMLYDFVERSGQLGSVLTVYELTKLDDSGLDDDLKNMGYNLLVRVLKKVLVKQGKAQILMNDDGTQIGGVKIV